MHKHVSHVREWFFPHTLNDDKSYLWSVDVPGKEFNEEIVASARRTKVEIRNDDIQMSILAYSETLFHPDMPKEIKLYKTNAQGTSQFRKHMFFQPDMSKEIKLYKTNAQGTSQFRKHMFFQFSDPMYGPRPRIDQPSVSE